MVILIINLMRYLKVLERISSMLLGIVSPNLGREQLFFALLVTLAIWRGGGSKQVS